jgi:hypothetical protein
MDKVLIVYEGPIFEQGVPQEVPAAFAQNLIENNPAPWQPQYCDRYAIADGGEE